uniref:(northern house mosquito) hypothetical protein n=1 Tax=Culex pipiens TaxID=7175 RepID=A0A8D8DCQ8_CULPI
MYLPFPIWVSPQTATMLSNRVWRHRVRWISAGDHYRWHRRRSLHVVWRRWPVHVLGWSVGVRRLATVLRGRGTLHRHVATLSTVRMGWSLAGCHMGWALRWPGRRRLVRTVRRRRRGGTLRWWPHRTRSLRRRHRTVDWRWTRHFYHGINSPTKIH